MTRRTQEIVRGPIYSSNGNGNGTGEFEEYRWGTSMLANAAWEKRYCSILFGSALGGEGTTAVVLHFAHFLRSSYGLNPLVVELNRLRPSLATMLGLDPHRSVAAVAAGKLDALDSIQRVSSFSVIPMGTITPGNRDNSWGVGPVLQHILDQAKKHFDLVLVDTPPLLETTDALAAGRVVPRMILVVEAGRTSFEVLDQVKRELEPEKLSIVGTVLNKHKRSMPDWLYNRLAA